MGTLPYKDNYYYYLAYMINKLASDYIIGRY
jgi:hypothetical protein